MIVLKAGKIKIIFRFGFFFAAALFCLIDTAELAVCVFCSCIIHEIGHIAAAVLCNVKIEKITFDFGGIKMVSECKIKSLGSDIFILLSGPFFNIAAAFLYYNSECYTSFSVNLILALFNLLPFSPLDGGAILKKSLEYFCLSADLVIKVTAVLAALAVCILMYSFSVENILVYAVIIFLGVCEIIY